MNILFTFTISKSAACVDKVLSHSYAYFLFHEEYQSSKLHSVYGSAASTSLLQRALAGVLLVVPVVMKKNCARGGTAHAEPSRTDPSYSCLTSGCSLVVAQKLFIYVSSLLAEVQRLGSFIK